MVFNKLFRIFKKPEDLKETVTYHLAEQIIGEAIDGGIRSINIKCLPKERFFGAQNEFNIDGIDEEELNSPIKMRHADCVFGIFLRDNGKDRPYMSLPVNLFLPLLNTLSSEKTDYKGKRCFVIYEKNSSPKTIEKYLDLTLYWENDSSISIDFEEIK